MFGPCTVMASNVPVGFVHDALNAELVSEEKVKAVGAFGVKEGTNISESNSIIVFCDVVCNSNGEFDGPTGEVVVKDMYTLSVLTYTLLIENPILPTDTVVPFCNVSMR